MKSHWLWLGPLAALPILLAGLWLWHDQGAVIWFSGMIAACF